jgi:hypothetical protein
MNIGEDQRLQFSINHFDESSDDPEFISDPSVNVDPDSEKAHAIPVDFECIDIKCNDSRRTTTLNLNHSNTDIFGSLLRLQGFYRYFTGFSGNQPVEDTFTGDFPTSTLGICKQKTSRCHSRAAGIQGLALRLSRYFISMQLP